MEKKLPKVFANKIEKQLDNNKSVFYSNTKEDSVAADTYSSTENNSHLIGPNVNQKINSIFSSPRYVYKADVDITTRDGIVSKRIIGRNGTHLITIDNELIPITDVVDINFSE